MKITYVYSHCRQIEVKKRIEFVESRSDKPYSKSLTDLGANRLFFLRKIVRRVKHFHIIRRLFFVHYEYESL